MNNMRTYDIKKRLFQATNKTFPIILIIIKINSLIKNIEKGDLINFIKST